MVTQHLSAKAYSLLIILKVASGRKENRDADERCEPISVRSVFG